MKVKGFTLIELLIVVAIIGILAAIAIPNFLQAQVRAKAARVQAEHGTVGTAVELYYVDNTTGPPDWVGGWPFYLSASLTTPIDYMSGMVLYDPFPTRGWPRFHIATRYRFKNLEIGTFDYTYSNVPPGTVIDQKTLGRWVIYSNGPWRALALPPGFSDGANAGDWLWLPYDPTNGTVSRGCIIRSQTMQDSRSIEYDLSRFP